MLSPTLLGHPYLLAWCHQAKARELLHADTSISHFPNREDDIRITKANLIWWPQARKQLQNTVPILAYYPLKCTPTPRSATAGMSLPQPSLSTSKLVLKDGGYAFLNLHYPYLALMDREPMEEYLHMPAAEINKTSWGIREKANQGLTF